MKKPVKVRQIRRATPKKFSDAQLFPHSTSPKTQSLKSYTKAALRAPTSFGDVGLREISSLLGMSKRGMK